MNDIIYLTIGSKYVSHWGFWESARELLQNAIDTGFETVTNMRSNNILTISSSGGTLDVSSLALGETSKSCNSSSIGQYGEGYKLALLVLCRLGNPVIIKNGLDSWIVSLTNHPQLNVECLSIEIHKDVYCDDLDHENRVTFILRGVTEDNFNQVSRNYISSHDKSGLKIIAEHNGSYCFKSDAKNQKVFVNGLFVCDLGSDYHYSYSFSPALIQLDRDRGSVDSFSLQREATRLFVDTGNIELLLDMANQKAKDISDYYSIEELTTFSSCGGSMATRKTYDEQTTALALKSFKIKHGENAHPINESLKGSKELAEQCVLLGLFPIAVKPLLYDLIKGHYSGKIKLTKINGKISDNLSQFLKLNRNKMESIARNRLSDLITSIKLSGE